MKIIYMGTPDFAVPALEALHGAGHEIVAVYSQPPRPAGRGKALRPSPVHARAEALGLAVRTPVSLKGAEEQAAFAALNADVAVVAAYGLILPQAVLDAPVNMAASIFTDPCCRAGAELRRSSARYWRVTRKPGVQVMQMEAGLDTGPIRATARTPVDGKTAGDLTDELADLGARLMVEGAGRSPRLSARAQSAEDGITYAAKIIKERGADRFFGQARCRSERQVRAFHPHRARSSWRRALQACWRRKSSAQPMPRSAASRRARC
jgi:methionyl-tRNA formyltransferase